METHDCDYDIFQPKQLFPDEDIYGEASASEHQRYEPEETLQLHQLQLTLRDQHIADPSRVYRLDEMLDNILPEPLSPAKQAKKSRMRRF